MKSKVILLSFLLSVASIASALTVNAVAKMGEEVVTKTFTCCDQQFDDSELCYTGANFKLVGKVTEVATEGPVMMFELTDASGEMVAQPMMRLAWNEQANLTLNSMDNQALLELTVVASE